MKVLRFFAWMGALVPALLVGLVWGVEGAPFYVSIFFTLASVGWLGRIDCRLLDREEEMEIALVSLLHSRSLLLADVERLSQELRRSQSNLKDVEVPDSLPEDF